MTFMQGHIGAPILQYPVYLYFQASVQGGDVVAVPFPGSLLTAYFLFGNDIVRAIPGFDQVGAVSDSNS